MKMYCITIYDEHYDKIKKFGYIPVGLGDNIQSSKYLSDKTGENIKDKKKNENDQNKTLLEADREKLEKKFAKDNNEKLN